jgi:uncharacterized protein DUF3465
LRRRPALLGATGLLAAWVLAWLVSTLPAGAPVGPAPLPAPAREAPAGDDGVASLLAAARDRRVDAVVTVRAPVIRLLPDDRAGSPHQRFLLGIGGRLTVLVAHNLALAPRVPVAAGDTVTVRGEYEWTPKGGVLHWTHDDPAGRHRTGYVELHGRRYQ